MVVKEDGVNVLLTTEVKTAGIGKLTMTALVISVDGEEAHRQWFSTEKDAEAARASVAGMLWLLRQHGFLDTHDLESMKQMTRMEHKE